MSMGRGSYIVHKHCEWSFTAYLGLAVKAQEVRCWGGDQGEEDGNIPRLHVCYMGLGLWRSSTFVGLYPCTFL